NGDVLDTLPEAMHGYLCGPGEAEGIIGGIVRHAAFSPVFAALAEFCKVPGHRLMIVLGNHDLELMYPNIQEFLWNELCSQDDAARGRVTFATAGTGFRCRVGRKLEQVSVACVHGNEFDDWNAFEPRTLARLIRAGTLGYESPLTREAPNPGTQLVRDVMNGVKKEYPFVDLLKPEIAGVFTILLALAPEKISSVSELIRNMAAAQTVGAARVARVLGQSVAQAEAETVTPPAGQWSPSQNFAAFLGNGGNASELLSQAWQRTLDDREPEAFALEAGQVLGGAQLIRNLLGFWGRKINQNPKEALRVALKDWGGSPDTFDLDGPCDVFEALAKLQPNVNIVVAGHTHLRRQKWLPLAGSPLRMPLYLNTGTWIRLMRLELADFEAPRFDTLYAALGAKTLAALDELGPTTTLKQRTVAVIRPTPNVPKTQAAVCDFWPELAVDPASSFDTVCTPVKEWAEVRRG
ncbi:MAG TPA: hypothetical protein VJV79_14920, partial [Polyangiaceae bacterium]|nr:hypothetical protein [Polyangiaceae bacterium]